jgi:hypothetical protein
MFSQEFQTWGESHISQKRLHEPTQPDPASSPTPDNSGWLGGKLPTNREGVKTWLRAKGLFTSQSSQPPFHEHRDPPSPTLPFPASRPLPSSDEPTQPDPASSSTLSNSGWLGWKFPTNREDVTWLRAKGLSTSPSSQPPFHEHRDPPSPTLSSPAPRPLPSSDAGHTSPTLPDSCFAIIHLSVHSTWQRVQDTSPTNREGVKTWFRAKGLCHLRPRSPPTFKSVGHSRPSISGFVIFGLASTSTFKECRTYFIEQSCGRSSFTQPARTIAGQYAPEKIRTCSWRWRYSFQPRPFGLAAGPEVCMVPSTRYSLGPLRIPERASCSVHGAFSTVST